MRKIYSSILFLFVVLTANTQNNVFLTISPKIAGNDLAMASNHVSLTGVDFNLDHFDYYLSDLHIIHDGGLDLDLSDTVFLVEPNSYVLYLGYINVTNIEQINFAVGVPSNINTISGADAIDIAAYPAGHPLSFQDPSMHWGWSAGYMHMIIGGMADSNGDDIVDYTFELHNLGDNNYRHVQLPVVQTNTSSSQIDVYVNCHVDVWLKDIPLETVGVVHGTTGYNMEILKNVETETVFDQSATASVAEQVTKVGKVYFSNNADNLMISWQNVKDAMSFKLTDLSGKIIQDGTVENMNGSITFSNLASGMYTFQVYDADLIELNTLKVVK